VQLQETTKQIPQSVTQGFPSRTTELLQDQAVKHSGPSSPKSFVAGGVVLRWDTQRNITSDHWVIEVVQGYHLEFQRQPFQWVPGVTRSGSQEGRVLSEKEIQELLQKSPGGSSSITRSVCQLFVSNLQEGGIIPSGI